MKKFRIFERNPIENLFVREEMPFRRLARKAPPEGYPNSWILTDFTVNKKLVKQLTGSEYRITSDIRKLKVLSLPKPLFLVYFKSDSEAIRQIKRVVELGGKILPEPDSKKTPIRFRFESIFQALEKTWALRDRVSHLNISIHEILLSSLKSIDNLEGSYVEIGVYKGGSALSALNYMKLTNANREAYFVDTFSGFTYEAAINSWDSEWFGTHIINSDASLTYEEVKNNLETVNYPFRLLQANICDENDWEKLPTEIALLNIDVDMYEPTIAGLRYGCKTLISGGMILLEDSASTPRLYGAQFAMHEFLASECGKNFRHLALPTHDLLIKLK